MLYLIDCWNSDSSCSDSALRIPSLILYLSLVVAIYHTSFITSDAVFVKYFFCLERIITVDIYNNLMYISPWRIQNGKQFRENS